MDVRTLLRWLDDTGFTAPERDLVAAASRFVTGGPLRVARTNAEIARAARGAPVEAVALAGGENARRWLDELRHVRLEIRGDDLLAAGIAEGPEIGARLARALDRKLDGDVSGREQELAAALEG
jgi:tRNA nucleotidyltransferase (CCA-adding enzyme)